MEEVRLTYSATDVSVDKLVDFFVGWPDPPSPARRVEILNAADEVVSFYERLGGTRLAPAAWRNYDQLRP